jgi:hypothetical protein
MILPVSAGDGCLQILDMVSADAMLTVRVDGPLWLPGTSTLLLNGAEIQPAPERYHVLDRSDGEWNLRDGGAAVTTGPTVVTTGNRLKEARLSSIRRAAPRVSPLPATMSMRTQTAPVLQTFGQAPESWFGTFLLPQPSTVVGPLSRQGAGGAWNLQRLMLVPIVQPDPAKGQSY